MCFSNNPKASACRLAFNLRSAIELLFVDILSRAADEPREAAAAELRQLDAQDKARGYGGGYKSSEGCGGPVPVLIGEAAPEPVERAAAAAAYCKTYKKITYLNKTAFNQRIG